METNLATMPSRIGTIFDRVTKLLGKNTHNIQLAENFQLVSAGEPLNRVYSLRSGKVKLTRWFSPGREHLLEIIGEGEVFGLESLVGENVWFFSAISMEPAEIMWVDVEDLRKILADHANLELQLLRAFGMQARQQYERAMSVRDLDVPGRLAAVLLKLAQRFGEKNEEGAALPRGLTQLELSQMIGSSRETTNKILADFCERGWITYRARLITVVDTARLARRAS